MILFEGAYFYIFLQFLDTDPISGILFRKIFSHAIDCLHPSYGIICSIEAIQFKKFHI